MVAPFSKWNMNKTIQSDYNCVNKVLYMLQRDEQKAPINILSRSKALKTQKLCVDNIEKNQLAF